MLILLLSSDPTKIRSLSRPERQVHDFALMKLQTLGPTYVDHFKTVLANFPEFKSRLEAALRQSQSAQTSKTQQTNQQKATKDTTGNEPSIKLTTDFKAFVQ